MQKQKKVGKPIVLIGLPASGKSAVGCSLATRLGRPFKDLDAIITKQAGKPIPLIFRDQGEPAFRSLESAVLERCLVQQPVVVATGGGCVLSLDNRRLIQERSTVIWLDVRPDTAASRAVAAAHAAGVAGDNAISAIGAAGVTAGDLRPLLAGGDTLDRMKILNEERRPLYRECAAITVAVDDMSIADIVEELYATLA
jgi:shikimate kinase